MPNKRYVTGTLSAGVIIGIAVLVALSAGTATAQSEIDGCASLDQTGETYELTADIANGSTETCLEITADGVTLDGGGHAVDGLNRVDDDSYGIYVSDAQGVVLVNVVVTGWDTGIEFDSANDGTIRNSTISSNDWNGVRIVGENATVTDNQIHSNGRDGIRLHPLSDGSTVTDNVVRSNHRGINFGSDDTVVTGNLVEDSNWDGFTTVAENNTVTDNVAISNGNSGFGLWSAENNTLANNTARDNGENGIELESESHGNTVRGNLLRGNEEAALYINDSSGNLIEAVDIGPSTAPNTTISSTDANGVLLSAVDSPPAPPNGDEVGRYVEVETEPDAVEPFVQISVRYEDGDVSGIDEETLALWRFEGEWVAVDSFVDPEANLVTATVTEFGTMGLFPGEEPNLEEPDDDEKGDRANSKEGDEPTDDTDGSETGDGEDGTSEPGSDDGASDEPGGDDETERTESSDDGSADGDGAGFGILIAIAGALGAGYILRTD